MKNTTRLLDNTEQNNELWVSKALDTKGLILPKATKVQHDVFDIPLTPDYDRIEITPTASSLLYCQKAIKKRIRWIGFAIQLFCQVVSRPSKAVPYYQNAIKAISLKIKDMCGVLVVLRC